MWTDPIIEELHHIRQEYAARFDFDLDAIAQDLERQQIAGTARVVSFVEKTTTESIDLQTVKADLMQAFAEVEAHKRGEISLPTLSEFLQ